MHAKVEEPLRNHSTITNYLTFNELIGELYAKHNNNTGLDYCILIALSFSITTM